MIRSVQIPLLMLSHHSILHPLLIRIRIVVSDTEIVETAHNILVNIRDDM